MGQYAKEFASGPLKDRSGTISGVSQTVMPANGGRRFIFFQNNGANAMWVNFGTAAVADSPSIKIAAGLALPFSGNFCPTEAMYVIGTAADKWTAKEDKWEES